MALGIRQRLQRQAVKNLTPPDTNFLLGSSDLAPNTPSISEVSDIDLFAPQISANLSFDSIVEPLWSLETSCQKSTCIGCVLHPPIEESWDLENSWEQVSISGNLAGEISSGKSDGTLFLLKEDSQLFKEIPKGREVPVVSPSARNTPRGQIPTLNIFELLLPVLLPPLRTDLGQELLLPKELRPFQNYGVKWLTEHDSALLADAMGLGKTVQAITAFRVLVKQGKALRCLVICPKSVVSSWRKHFEEWAPEVQVATVRGTKQARDIQWAAYSRKVHVMLVNYELLLRDIDVASNHVFDVIIADEIQWIKNHESETSHSVRRLRGTRRWGLTGTPLENKPEDVVALFSFLKPGLFSTYELQNVNPSTVKSKIKPYMLRRLKESVLKELPSKVKDIRYVELDGAQHRAYQDAEKRGKFRLETGENITVQHVLALITKLKQICNFDPVTGESAKIDWLKDYVKTAVEEDSKVLIFSQFVKTLDKIEPNLANYSPLKFTGEVLETKREEIKQQFHEMQDNRVLLVSLKAGGTGITLTAANYVVHFDSWWNPAVMTQAEDRAHRIGQLKTVFVTTLVTENTIEERIQKLLEQKRRLFSQVIDDLSDTGLQKALSEEEIFGLFGLKSRRTKQPTKQTNKPVPSNYVFKPDEPFSNVSKLREIIRASVGYIWWEDPHFGSRALEELAFCVDPSSVKEIRIISRRDVFNDKAKSDYKRFSVEMKNKGVEVDWRLTENSIAHDRYLITSELTYNLPPVNSIFQGLYAESLTTTNRPPFEQWWDQASSVST